MRSAILEKLDKELLNEIKTEAQAVYILVEIRKVIKDHDLVHTSYPILYFFCDWAVHAKMDRKGAKQILDTIQNFYRGLDPHLGIKKNTAFFPFVMFIVLRIEFKLFLEKNNLSLNIVSNERLWENFLFCLLDVIIDCPLTSNEGFIKEFSFTKYDSRDHISCVIKSQSDPKQEFISKDKYDFIQKNFTGYYS